MNTGNWTKLYGNTIYSTVWQEPPAIRCVWITMLALADFEGYVGASVPGLAKAANVELEVTEAALERFKAPDKYSRSKENDGRRIEDAPGGWRILNFVAHRDGNEDQRDKWARQKRIQRARKKEGAPSSGRPQSGETAALAALANGHQAGADAIVQATLPEREEPEIPEIPNRTQEEPATESGSWIDGVWVPD